MARHFQSFNNHLRNCFHAMHTQDRPIRSTYPLSITHTLFHPTLHNCTHHLKHAQFHTSSALYKASTMATRLGTQEELEELKTWLMKFQKDAIPVQTFAITHNRSSGAGGQNVNKVNTKVEMRFNVNKAQWMCNLTRKVFQIQEKNRINSQGEFVIASERHRTQHQNHDDCVDKIYECVLNASKFDADTSEEKKEKIKEHAKKSMQARLQDKQLQKRKKEDRRRTDW